MKKKFTLSSRIRPFLASASMAFAVITLVGCGGEDGLDGADADVLQVSSQPAAEDDCPAGGSELTFGFDTNDDGDIDDISHVEIICNGATGPQGTDGEDGNDGADGTPFTIETEAADECDNGGIHYRFGYDTTGDGEIDEVVSEETVCNGIDGEDGNDGNDGLPMLLETSAIGGEDDCLTGTTYTFGYDTTDDGQIDDVVSEESICTTPTVLYFVDGISASGDALLPGLQALENAGLINLTVAAVSTDFRDELENGNYNVSVYFAQANPMIGDDHDALLDWVESNGRLIFGTYTADGDNGLFAALGTSLTGSTNHDNITFTTPRSNKGLTDNLALFTDPWSTHSVGIEAQGSAVSICTFDDGDSCAVLGNDGRTLHVGVMSDVYPEAYAEQIALNLLGTVLESGY